MEHRPWNTTRGDAPPVAFYDAFERRLLTDYVTGNPRAEAALSLAARVVPQGRRNVLDIGCGIGWSTFELARLNPGAAVKGLDLSPALIATARTLFADARDVTFEAGDFLAADLPVGAFDVATLLDVYEHFPFASRADVHARLDALLTSNARIVIAAPTIDHQEFLRAEHPEGLQPVDEDVALGDFERLAKDVGGRVASYGLISVWRRNDYQHAVVERGVLPAVDESRGRLEPRRDRQVRVQQRLGLRWTPSFGFVASRGPLRVCIATERPAGITTETFIREHVEHLPVSVVVSDECRLPSAVSQLIRITARRLGKDPLGVEDLAYGWIAKGPRARLLARNLRRAGVRVVLAEFGPKAVELYPACRLARIPLVAHFHGYDAFRHDVLAQYADAYRSIFDERWPVVAVSESMKRQLVALGARADQVEVVPYGIDLDRFRPGAPTPGLVVAVGRFVEKKAPDIVVRAFAGAAARAPEAQLVMVGDGSLRPTVEALIVEFGIEGRVRLVGAREHSWIADTLSRASIFVQHSVVARNGDREGTPVAVLEAAASGVPVVATRHEGIAEVVVDGETGLLVDEHDVEGMSAAIAALLLDPERAQRLGAAGRARIESLYARGPAIDHLWRVVQRAVGESVGAPSDNEDSTPVG